MQMFNNPLQLIQMMMQGKNNPQQLMQMMGQFNNDPMFIQAQKMLSGGGNPQDIIKNVAREKGIDLSQLQQMAQQFGIKL